MSRHVKGYAERSDYGTFVGLLFKRGTGDHGDPLQFATLAWGPENPDDGSWHEPTVKMRPEDAQHLMDNLWQAGLRPAQGQQSEGAMAAQTRHLEDMRSLAFAKLEVPKP
jgi:hypothetical protein